MSLADLRRSLAFCGYRFAGIFLYTGLLLGTCLGIVACQSRAGIVDPLPQHPQIQVSFNHNLANTYTDPYRKIKRPGDNLEQIVIDNINLAKATVDIAVQELRLPNIAQALIERHQAGVRVRLILENNYSRAWSDYTAAEIARFDPREAERYADFLRFADLDGDGKLSDGELDRRDAIRAIEKAKLAWIDDTADGSKGSGLMHHKFVAIDGRTVLLTSANFTMSDMHGDFGRRDTLGNTNNLVKIDSKEVASLFTKEFDLMWGDGPGGKPDSLFGNKKPYRKIQFVLVGDAQVRLKFSPDRKAVPWEQTSNGLIGTVLAGAKNSIDLALFAFTEPMLSRILEMQQKQNVQIRALVESDFAYRETSSTLDMWGFVSVPTCKSGSGRSWAQPIKTVGVPSLPTGDRLHHKFGAIDRNLVLTGSHNWSNAANYTNDEALIAIQHPTVAAHFQREFDRLFDRATLGPTAKLSQEAPKTCANKPKKRNKKQFEVFKP